MRHPTTGAFVSWQWGCLTDFGRKTSILVASMIGTQVVQAPVSPQNSCISLSLISTADSRSVAPAHASPATLVQSSGTAAGSGNILPPNDGHDTAA